VSKGSITLPVAVALVCLAVGTVSGVVVSSVAIGGTEAIEIPEGTLVILENGDSYYYYENGIVTANLTLLLPENYGISSDNLVITIPDYVPVSGIYTVWVHGPISITIWNQGNLEWTEGYNWLNIEGWPDMITVDWPEGHYDYSIEQMPKVLIVGSENWENRLVFTLRRSG